MGKRKDALRSTHHGVHMISLINDIAYDPAVIAEHGTSREGVKKVAQEMESLFIYQLMKEMDKSVHREENDIMYGGQAEDTFRNVMFQELARDIAQSGSFGLAAMIEESIANADDTAEQQDVSRQG